MMKRHQVGLLVTRNVDIENEQTEEHNEVATQEQERMISISTQENSGPSGVSENYSTANCV